MKSKELKKIIAKIYVLEKTLNSDTTAPEEKKKAEVALVNICNKVLSSSDGLRDMEQIDDILTLMLAQDIDSDSVEDV